MAISTTVKEIASAIKLVLSGLNKNAFILHEDEDELRGTTSIRLLTKAHSVADHHRLAL